MKASDLVILRSYVDDFIGAKNEIIIRWVYHHECAKILERHAIEQEWFLEGYASKVFDYFLGVIIGEMRVGECPVIAELIEYLKNKELRADELFTLCSHFKRSAIQATYHFGGNSEAVFTAISHLFDQNFASVLKLYTNTIYEKEQEAMNAARAKEFFLSNMSHEIRTPLNAILGFVALLRDETMNPRHQSYLDIIANSGENLLHIINDILDFSKLRSGEFTIDPIAFNIHHEISDTMELFVPSANVKQMTLTSFIDPSIPSELIADPLRMKQIVGNFLSNAIKFSPVGGTVHVEANFDDNWLNIIVKDQGSGIDLADQERIFDAFSQAQEGGCKSSGGSGLGLSICKQLVMHMGGNINVTSALGKGSTFSLHIPVTVNVGCDSSRFDTSLFEGLRFALLHYSAEESYKLESLFRYWNYFGMEIEVVDAPSEEYDVLIFLESSINNEWRSWIETHSIPSIAILDFLDNRYDRFPHIAPLTFPIYCTKMQTALMHVLGKYNEAKPAQHPQRNKRFKGRILVAEDNYANQALIQMLLEKYGLDVEIVNNGREALDAFKSSSFDLVFMDEQMPIMDGNMALKLILEWCEKEQKPLVPVVALTANVINGAKERFMAQGFNAFCAKPIMPREIEVILEKLLPVSLHANDRDVCRVDSDVSSASVQFELLKQILMLEAEQIHQLLQMYQEKMERLMPQLHEAIEAHAFDTIAFIAHSIKGSSANFRFKEMTQIATLIESAAKKQDLLFPWTKMYRALNEELLLTQKWYASLQ